MLKRTGALLITAAALSGAGAASAATGARMTFEHRYPKHTFTLRAARALDERYALRQGWAIQGTACGWVNVHVASCASRLTVVVIDGQPAEHYTVVDYVTRSGPCSTPVVKRGVAKGGHRFGNCFTGPLVVLPHAIYANDSALT